MGVIAFAPRADAQTVKRITFARRATSAVVTGSLRNFQGKRYYVVRVRRGQTLRIEQLREAPSHNEITVFIKGPKGDDVSDADASCNNRKEVTPTVAGDYRITVVECQKVSEWSGTFQFRITVR